MTQTNGTSVKILFRFFSNVLDQWTVKTIWADTVDDEKGLYKLDSIPFYAPVASDDIVFAEYDEKEQRLNYRETVEYSGNSTVLVILLNTTIDISAIRDMFEDLSCISENLNDCYFSMEVPADRDYTPIRQKLAELEEKNYWIR